MNPFTDTNKITEDVIRKTIHCLHIGQVYLLPSSSTHAFTSPMFTLAVTDLLGNGRELFLPLLQDHIFAKVELFEILDSMIIPQLRGQVILPGDHEPYTEGSRKASSYIRLHYYPDLMEDYIILRDALYHKIK